MEEEKFKELATKPGDAGLCSFIERVAGVVF